MKHLGDITKIHGAAVPPVEVIIGGSPCQDLSVAGKREGLKEAIKMKSELLDALRLILINVSHADQSFTDGRYEDMKRRLIKVKENVERAIQVLEANT